MEKAIPIYTVDAFTDEPFRGNPAAVCLVPKGMNLPDETLQTIAEEMNLSETAYVEHLTDDSSFQNSDKFKLRWFTPTNEVALCGHATLASAAVLMFSYGNTSEEICFNSMSGPLIAKRNGDMITLDFPLNPTQKIDFGDVKTVLKEVCDEALIKDVEYSPNTKKLLVRLNDEVTRTQLESLTPDTKALQQSEQTGKIKGVIVTLKGSEANHCIDKTGKMYDFVSRYFAPWVGIPEDPVTGAAHTVLSDYWRKQLGKTTFYARQCSARGGEMTISVQGDRVNLSGNAQIILKGELFI